MRTCLRGAALASLSVVLLCLASCGDNGPSIIQQMGSTPQATGDFLISVTPGTVNLSQGQTSTITVSLSGSGGFSSPVSLTIAGLPSAVTATPSSFTVSAGGSQTVTVAASASAALGSSNITVTGTSGTLSHSAGATLQLLSGTAHFRMRYFDTGSQLTADLSYNPQQHVLYDRQTRRFFFADAAQNLVFVYDAQTERQIASITVPGAWTLDQSPDGGLLYVGTQVGDIYVIDPSGLTIKEWITAKQIGPSGYAAYEVFALADGRFALLGNQGGIPAVDGYSSFAIWNRVDNSLSQYTTSYGSAIGTSGQEVCGSLISFAYLAVSPDRTKLLLGSADSDATVCQFDTTTGQYETTTAPGELYVGTTTVFQPADGLEFLTTSRNTVYIYNRATMEIQDQFTLSNLQDGPRCILSLDGNTLYAIARNTGAVFAYNWRTHTLTGWTSSPTGTGYYTDLVPLAIDETGLIGGLRGHGIGFADGGALNSGTPQEFTNAFVTPNVGPVGGGTQVQFGNTSIDQTTQNIYFGTQAASNVSVDYAGFATAVSPAHASGPVDVTLQTSKGGLVSAFNGFSYGPQVTQVLTPVSAASGGGVETLLGYGFGSSDNGIPSDLRVSVGGQSVNVTAFKSQFEYSDGERTPLQSIQFPLPPGNGGMSSEITVSNAEGSTAAPTPVTYLPPIEQFVSPGGLFYQGIYDSRRDVYYFTDLNQVRVFSLPQRSWLQPIPMPTSPGVSQRLAGISLSPDGTRLAVSDAEADVVYVLNPDTPSTVTAFPLPNTILDAGTEPCGLAISDLGIVYYASFQTNGTGALSFHKLDTNTGTVTPYSASLVSSNGPSDMYTRVILSADNRYVFYLQQGGYVIRIDTATDQVEHTPAANYPDYELALSPKQTTVAAGEAVFDINLNLQAFLSGSEVQTQGVQAVYGEKFSADGKLLFEPLLNGIEVFDATTGVPLEQIALPFQLCWNYDALVSDEHDNVLIAITGFGDGIAVIDLRSLPEPSPLLSATRAYAKSSPNEDRLISGVEAPPVRRSGPSEWERISIPHLVQRRESSAPHTTTAPTKVAPRTPVNGRPKLLAN